MVFYHHMEQIQLIEIKTHQFIHILSLLMVIIIFIQYMSRGKNFDAEIGFYDIEIKNDAIEEGQMRIEIKFGDVAIGYNGILLYFYSYLEELIMKYLSCMEHMTIFCDEYSGDNTHNTKGKKIQKKMSYDGGKRHNNMIKTKRKKIQKKNHMLVIIHIIIKGKKK
eukprot:134455_1